MKMKELKEFVLSLDGERASYSSGEVMQGSISVTFNEPAEMQNIKVQFYGEAICRWDSVHGAKDRNKNGNKKPKVDEVVKLEKVLFGAKNGEATESIPTHPNGSHRYEFEFNLPNYLPCSFESPKQRDIGIAYIRYYLTASITRPWRSDISRRKTININEIVDTSLPEYAYRPGCQAQKQLGMCFSDGLLSIEAHLDQICYRPQGTILISTLAENESTRIMSSVFAKLYRRTRYHRKRETKTYLDIVAEYFGERVLPRKFIRWENLEFKIPAVTPSIMNSKRIRVDYFLRVGMYQLYRDEIHVDLPIVIGTTIEFLEEQKSQQQQQILLSLPTEIRASLSPQKENPEIENHQKLEEIADIFMQLPYTGKRPSVQYISALARKNRKNRHGSTESTPRKIDSDDSDASFYGDERIQLSKSADFYESGYYNDMDFLSPTSNLSSRRASETSLHVSSPQKPQLYKQKRLSNSLRISQDRQPMNATPRDADHVKEPSQRSITKSQSYIKDAGQVGTSTDKSTAKPSPRKASPVKRPTMRKAASHGTIDMKTMAQIAAGLGKMKSGRSMIIKPKEDSTVNGEERPSKTDEKITNSPPSPKLQRSGYIESESMKRSASLPSPVKSQEAYASSKDFANSPTKSASSPMKRPTVRKATSQGTVDMKVAAQVATGLGNFQRKGAMKMKGKDENKIDAETADILHSGRSDTSSKDSTKHPKSQRNEVGNEDSSLRTTNIPTALASAPESLPNGSAAQRGTSKQSANTVPKRASLSRRSLSRSPDMSPIAGSQQSSPVKEVSNQRPGSKATGKEPTVEPAMKSSQLAQPRASRNVAERDLKLPKKSATDTAAQKRFKKAENRLSAVKTFASPRGKSGNTESSRPGARRSDALKRQESGDTAINSSAAVKKGILQQRSGQTKPTTQAAQKSSIKKVTGEAGSRSADEKVASAAENDSLAEVNNNSAIPVAEKEVEDDLQKSIIKVDSIALKLESEEPTAVVENDVVPAVEDTNLQRTPSLDHFEMLESDLQQEDKPLEYNNNDKQGESIPVHVNATSQASKLVVDEAEIIAAEQVTNLERAPSLDEFERFEQDAMQSDQTGGDAIDLQITLDSRNPAQAVGAVEGADPYKEQAASSIRVIKEKRISRVRAIDSSGNTIAEREDTFEVSNIPKKIGGSLTKAAAADGDVMGVFSGTAENEVGSQALNGQAVVHDSDNAYSTSPSFADGDFVADISQNHRSNSARGSISDLNRGFYTPPEFIDDDAIEAPTISQVDIVNISQDSANTSTEDANLELDQSSPTVVNHSGVRDENESRAPSKAHILWNETFAKVRKNHVVKQPVRRRSVVNIRVTNKEG